MKKILIIEDDQIVANIYRNKFSVEGFLVEIALDGQTGMELLQSFRPDAVILDLMLPKITGVEFMKQIRATPEFEKLPVIVFSNTYLTNMVQEAWKAGATKCLSKANCTPKQVIDVLRTTLSNGASSTATTNGNGHSPGTSTLQRAGHSHPPTLTRPAPGDTATELDAEFQGELLATFNESLPATLVTLRAQLQTLIKADNEATRVRQVQDLYRRIHALTGNAAIVGLSTIAHMSDALEALLRELSEKPKNMNPSTLRTVASTIDFLGILFEHRNRGKSDPPAPNILVVDDEAISRRAVTYALEKAKLKSTAIEDPVAAYDMLSKDKYELVFLDVDMPVMNGFELCSKLRTLPGYKKTPVVFVTSLNDFESRANSTMSGGNDFIVKPFLFMELAVKALVYVLKGQVAAAAAAK
jgi:DNA-binding response OmpR family regulator